MTADAPDAPTAADGRRVAEQPDLDGGNEVAAELRRLVALVAGSRFGDVGSAAADLRAVADRLEASAERIDPATFETWGVPEHIGSNPVIGVRNPIARPLEPWLRPDGTVDAEVTLGAEFQGPPGCVHGGIVALLFDEMLGIANAAAHKVGMTVDLRVTYVSPTPLDTPLRLQSRQVHSEGRKLWSTGTLHAGDRLCASVEGMFVTPRGMAAGAEERPVEG